MHRCRPLCMAVWCLSTRDGFTHTEEAFRRYSGDKRTSFWVHGATGKQGVRQAALPTCCAVNRGAPEREPIECRSLKESIQRRLVKSEIRAHNMQENQMKECGQSYISSKSDEGVWTKLYI